jgi:hypothetical protein
VTLGAPLTQAALSGLSGPLRAFVRDDDAGWEDERLLRLLDLFGEADVPIDLAAIPVALGDRLARHLADRIDAGGRVGVHLHGCSHTNHETEGRKCEFGVSRSPAQQRMDIDAGWRILSDRLGDRADRIFTPPWNRCAPWTPGLLAEQRFAGLSREHRAKPADALPSLDVCLDWSRLWREGGPAAMDAAWATALQDCGRAGRPLGLMLHHAVMEPQEFDCLRAWLDLLQQSEGLTWHPMRGLLDSGRAAAIPAHGVLPQTIHTH